MFYFESLHFPRLAGVSRGLVAASAALALVGASVGVAAGVNVTPHTAVQPGVYVPLSPSRVLDTRYNNIPVNGFVNARGALTFNVPRTVIVWNQFPSNPAINVPSTAIAITGNVTVTGGNATGFVTLEPDPLLSPGTSTINFVAGQTIANAFVAKLSSAGAISAIAESMSKGLRVQVILDITGYFLPAAGGDASANYRAGSAVTNGTDGTVSVTFSALSGSYAVSLTGNGAPVIAYVTDETSTGFKIHAVGAGGGPALSAAVDWIATLRNG